MPFSKTGSQTNLLDPRKKFLSSFKPTKQASGEEREGGEEAGKPSSYYFGSFCSTSSPYVIRKVYKYRNASLLVIRAENDDPDEDDENETHSVQDHSPNLDQNQNLNPSVTHNEDGETSGPFRNLSDYSHPFQPTLSSSSEEYLSPLSSASSLGSSSSLSLSSAGLSNVPSSEWSNSSSPSNRKSKVILLTATKPRSHQNYDHDTSGQSTASSQRDKTQDMISSVVSEPVISRFIPLSFYPVASSYDSLAAVPSLSLSLSLSSSPSLFSHSVSPSDSLSPRSLSDSVSDLSLSRTTSAETSSSLSLSSSISRNLPLAPNPSFEDQNPCDHNHTHQNDDSNHSENHSRPHGQRQSHQRHQGSEGGNSGNENDDETNNENANHPKSQLSQREIIDNFVKKHFSFPCPPPSDNQSHSSPENQQIHLNDNKNHHPTQQKNENSNNTDENTLRNNEEVFLLNENTECLVRTDFESCACVVPCSTIITQLRQISANPNFIYDPPQILITNNRATILPGPAKILGWLWLGDRYHARDDDLLERKKISLIVNCTRECKNHFPEQFTYYNLPLRDNITEDISKHFGDAFKQIEEARKTDKSVFIHCQMGVSRSATITLAYLMLHKGWTLLESYQHVMCRREIKPNPRFAASLIDYEKSLFKKNSMFFCEKSSTLKSLSGPNAEVK